MNIDVRIGALWSSPGQHQICAANPRPGPSPSTGVATNTFDGQSCKLRPCHRREQPRVLNGIWLPGKQVKAPIFEKLRKIEAPPKTLQNVVIIHRKYDNIGLFH